MTTKIKRLYPDFYCGVCHKWTRKAPSDTEGGNPICSECGDFYSCGECGFEIDAEGTCQRERAGAGVCPGEDPT